MDAWSSLLRAAILGTERVQVNLQSSGAAGELLRKISQRARSREAVLLDSAALLAAHRRAGALIEPADRAAIEVAGVENLPVVNAASTGHLVRLLADESGKRLLPEWLAAVSTAGRRVPELLLPELLDAVRQNRGLRAAVEPVLGARGRWLAAQNPEWSFAAGAPDADPAADWETSAAPVRLIAIERLRQTDPARARALVEAAWNTERAKERASFVAAFAAGLSMEDEPFLETVLDDRGKEVRRAAAELLVRLPSSRLVGRMIDRAQTLLDVRVTTRLLGAPKVSLEVKLPHRLDAALQRDGIIEDPPGAVGKRAWWLHQIIAAAPPSIWSDRPELATLDRPKRIAALLEAAQAHELAGPILHGWATAALQQGDRGWAEALIEAELADDPALWRLLETGKRERLLSARLDPKRPVEERQRALAAAIELGVPLGEPLSRVVMKALRDVGAAADAASGLDVRDLVLDSAVLLPWSIASELIALWAPEPEGPAIVRRAMEQAVELLRLRRELHQAILES